MQKFVYHVYNVDSFRGRHISGRDSSHGNRAGCLIFVHSIVCCSPCCNAIQLLFIGRAHETVCALGRILMVMIFLCLVSR